MKKLFSSMVLLTVLACAVSVIAGCGEKPAKETVWKYVDYKEGARGVKMLTFHRDGYVYVIEHRKSMGPPAREWDEVKNWGKYSINAAAKKISFLNKDGTENSYYIYTEDKDMLILTKLVVIKTKQESNINQRLKKTSDMTADEIKKLVK